MKELDANLQMPIRATPSFAGSKRGYDGCIMGLDLDNTLIRYDELFHELALSAGLVPPHPIRAKRQIRDYVRELPDGDAAWQRLQAQAYGPALGRATAADGALDFIRAARSNGARVVIISHKTLFANVDSERFNLHDAARVVLHEIGFIGSQAILEDDVYFEPTRDEKIKRIGSVHCTHFVDDLEEVLNDVSFPSNIRRMLFSGTRRSQATLETFQSFHEIASAFDA